ncbi:hypothetical protein B9R14_01880 [Acetivibrio saccincola]|uniref:Uncharacterized protein n=1 Tax=Acetivibrio saccincola TaxID=1677857 RepID=A0A2S8R769_9FIRM|nr:hypothetical protein B9R14_01880 [Acetivibrio saccincola]
MKRYIIYIIILAIVVQMSNVTAFSKVDIKTVQESLKVANEFLEENLGYYNYLTKKILKDIK